MDQETAKQLAANLPGAIRVELSGFILSANILPYVRMMAEEGYLLIVEETDEFIIARKAA